MAGLETGYGILGAAFQGKWGEAFKQLVVQSATFAAFGAVHELQLPNGKPVEQAIPDSLHDLINDMGRHGIPRGQVADRIKEIDDWIMQGDAGPDVEAMPEGPTKEYARAMVAATNIIRQERAQQAAQQNPGMQPKANELSPNRAPEPMQPARPATMPEIDVNAPKGAETPPSTPQVTQPPPNAPERPPEAGKSFQQKVSEVWNGQKIVGNDKAVQITTPDHKIGLQYNPEAKTLKIDFGRAIGGPEGFEQVGATGVSPGGLSLARNLRDMLGWASENGVGIKYQAQTNRQAAAYERTLTNMGFTKAEDGIWRVQPEAPMTPIERMRARQQAQGQVSPEAAPTQAPRKMRTLEAPQAKPTLDSLARAQQAGAFADEAKRAGMTPLESAVMQKLFEGETSMADLAKDPAMKALAAREGLAWNFKQQVDNTQRRAMKKIGEMGTVAQNIDRLNDALKVSEQQASSQKLEGESLTSHWKPAPTLTQRKGPPGMFAEERPDMPEHLVGMTTEGTAGKEQSIREAIENKPTNAVMDALTTIHAKAPPQETVNALFDMINAFEGQKRFDIQRVLSDMMPQVDRKTLRDMSQIIKEYGDAERHDAGRGNVEPEALRRAINSELQKSPELAAPHAPGEGVKRVQTGEPTAPDQGRGPAANAPGDNNANAPTVTPPDQAGSDQLTQEVHDATTEAAQAGAKSGTPVGKMSDAIAETSQRGVEDGVRAANAEFEESGRSAPDTQPELPPATGPEPGGSGGGRDAAGGFWRGSIEDQKGSFSHGEFFENLPAQGKAGYDTLRKFIDGLHDEYGKMGGRLFPATSKISEPTGNAMARLIAVNEHARRFTGFIIDKVCGPNLTPQENTLYGTTLNELRLRTMEGYYGKQAADLWQQGHDPALPITERTRLIAESAKMTNLENGVGTMVGAKDSVLATVQDYQAALNSPRFQEIREVGTKPDRLSGRPFPHFQGHRPQRSDTRRLADTRHDDEPQGDPGR